MLSMKCVMQLKLTLECDNECPVPSPTHNLAVVWNSMDSRELSRQHRRNIAVLSDLQSQARTNGDASDVDSVVELYPSTSTTVAVFVFCLPDPKPQ